MISTTERLANAIIQEYVSTSRCGDRLPSIRELAAKYRVSNNSIAHAIDALAVQGIVEKRHGSGCYVASRVSAATLNAAQLLGLVIQADDYELMMRVYRGVHRAVRRENYHLVVGNANWDYEQERSEVAQMVSAGCQAVIVYPATRTGRQLQSDYLNSEFTQTPIVLIDMAYPCQKRPQVIFDNYDAALRLTEKLISLGHKRIAFMDVSVPDDEWMLRSHRDRRQGYSDALGARGIEVRPQDIWMLDRWSWGEDDLREYLIKSRDGDEPVTAVFALEDSVAIMATAIARELGIEVPVQLQIVGADNLSISSHFWPPFPTTAQDFERAGEIATRIALQMTRGEAVGQLIYMLPAPVRLRGMPSFGQDRYREQE